MRTHPAFPGQEAFGGRVVPQHWPRDLNVSAGGSSSIGSGATAVSLVPALAEDGAQVTMLQRSPSHILVLPSRDGPAAGDPAPGPGRGRAPGRPLAQRASPEALYALPTGAADAAGLIRAQVERALGGASRRPRTSRRPTNRGTSGSGLPRTATSSRRSARGTPPSSDEVASFTVRAFGSPPGPSSRPTSSSPPPDCVSRRSAGSRSPSTASPSTGGNGPLTGRPLSGVPNAAVSIGYANASWTLRAASPRATSAGSSPT